MFNTFKKKHKFNISFYILFLFFLIFFIKFSTVDVNANTYKVTNLEISKTYDNDFKKEEVIDIAFKKAFEELILKITTINREKASKLSDQLNDLLANYQMFYQNVRGLHWNIKGKDFFELHVKFEEFYDDAVIKIDEIAERVLTLGHEPLHTFSDYIKVSEITEAKGITNGKDGVEVIVANFSTLIQKEREILSLAGEADDEGTVSLMSDYITETEKTLWMLDAYLR